MDRTPRIPSRALGSRSAASAARSAAGSGALEVRADPKGNLGKPRSGIPPPHPHPRFSPRRRGPAPGSISPARAADLPPRLRGSPGRSPGVLALSKFPWLGGEGGGAGANTVGLGGGFPSRMGVDGVGGWVPFAWGIKDHDLPLQNSLAKVGTVSKSVFCGEASPGGNWSG